MSEIERFIHLIASMQILFGSRRGGFLIPLLLIGLGVGGWMAYRHYYSPERALETAHQMWDSNDTKQQIQAIKKYRELLQKSDPLDPGRRWLKDDRDTLYRRIVIHEVKFRGDEDKAAEWVLAAWDEGIRDLRIQDDEVKEFWNATITELKEGDRNRKRNQIGSGKFQTLPGID